MGTAGIIADSVAESAPKRRRGAPLPLRPLHGLWRRSIDRLDLRRVALPVRGLPAALEGMVACQISDFHVDREEDLQRLGQAIDLINRQQPAFVFLTGDYFSGRETMRRYLLPFGRELRRLRAGAGIFAIAGNHDHWASFDHIANTMRAAGIEVLSNESRRVEIRDTQIVVVGIDDLWTRRADPARAFRHVSPHDCSLVLAHNPDTALYARHLAPGVMLCGHTHGGVVRLPYYGSPLRSILRLGKQYYAGLNRYGDFFIYTNRGLGTFWLRVRINCRPEVSHFRLTSDFNAPATVKVVRRLKRRPRQRRLRRVR